MSSDRFTVKVENSLNYLLVQIKCRVPVVARLSLKRARPTSDQIIAGPLVEYYSTYTACGTMETSLPANPPLNHCRPQAAAKSYPVVPNSLQRCEGIASETLQRLGFHQAALSTSAAEDCDARHFLKNRLTFDFENPNCFPMSVIDMPPSASSIISISC